MAMLDKNKALSRMYLNMQIVRAVLATLSEDDARNLRDKNHDGSDGWNSIEIVAHMRDIEDVFLQRARNIVEQDHPTHTPVDPDQLARERNYAGETLTNVLTGFEVNRERFLTYLDGLSDEQFARTGFHPEAGEHTLLDLAINTALHDTVHIHQILKATGRIGSE